MFAQPLEDGLRAIASSYASVALLAPPGTPPEIVARMSNAVQAFAAAREFRTKREATGLEPTPILDTEFAKYVANERSNWEGVVRAARIQPR